MEPGRAEPLEAAGRNERKWFITTVIACFVVFLAFSAFIGVKYWVLPDITREIIRNEEDTNGKIRELADRYDRISTSVEVPLILSSVVFLISMICWLLEIRDRRCHSVELAD